MRTIVAMLACWLISSAVAAIALGRFLRGCDQVPKPDEDGQENES